MQTVMVAVVVQELALPSQAQEFFMLVVEVAVLATHLPVEMAG
jgi:hypothetical protein